MIIGCPHCSTKFSIETDRLEGIKNPQFHCSRCDHLFALADVSEPLLKPEEEEESASAAPTDETEHVVEENEMDEEIDDSDFDPFAGFGEDSDSDYSTTQNEPELEFPEEFTIEASSTEEVDQSPELVDETTEEEDEEEGTQLDLLSFTSENPSKRHRISTLIDESDSPLVTASWPGENGNDVLEADMRSVLDQHQSAITEVIGVEPPSAKPTIFKRDQFETSSKEIAPILKDRLTETASSPIIEFPRQESAPIETFDDFDLDLDLDPEINAVGTLAAEQIPSVPGKRSSASLWISTPILFALILGGASYHLKNDTNLSNSLLQLTSKKHTIAAPDGVSLEDLQPSIVALDNGAQILQLEGIVSNDTPQAFKNVRIEATLLDKENKPLQRVLVTHNNGLNSVSRIESLKKDIVESLQEKQIREEQVLKPKSKPNFKVAFTDNIEQAGWVTARIYSAETDSI